MGASIAEQIAAVLEEMASRPAGLLRHVERVLVEALDLARRYDLDPERTELAVRGHDLFRAERPERLLQLSRQAGLDVTGVDERNPVMLHGPLAAVVLRERFNISDEEVLAAIGAHTAGAAHMPMLAKVILLADKFERRKRNRTPVMKEIRRLAWRDLDTALLCWGDWKWVEEREHGWESYPAHWEARVAWVREHHAEAALPGRIPDAEFEAVPA